MGVEGTLEYISDLLRSVKKKKKKQTQTVALKVRMDCEGCARKMKSVLSSVKGRYTHTHTHIHTDIFTYLLIIFLLYTYIIH